MRPAKKFRIFQYSMILFIYQLELRTTSVYHKKCVPDEKRNTLPRKCGFSRTKMPELKRNTQPKKYALLIKPNRISLNPANLFFLLRKSFTAKSVQTTPNMVVVNDDQIIKVKRIVYWFSAVKYFLNTTLILMAGYQSSFRLTS